MGCRCKYAALLCVAALGAWVALVLYPVVYKRATPPTLAQDEWWGAGEPRQLDDSIVPFKVHVPQTTLDDLRRRLDTARPLPASLEGVQHQYGIHRRLLDEVLQYWRSAQYDWRKREEYLNQYQQYLTRVQGLRMHYVHVKPAKVPKGVRVLPLLILHGWPGSIREFYKLIPMLTTPRPDKNFVFEIIAPSLPGYGFSEGASQPGLGSAQMAVVMKNLMAHIGFKRFYIQGGDWGAAIVSNMAAFYPDVILGAHSNMCLTFTPLSIIKHFLGALYPSWLIDPAHEAKLYPLPAFFANVLQEFGYMHQQATRPDTVGVALNDSPVGLAAYLLEKFIVFTDPALMARADGGLNTKYDYVELLDNLMIYWVTGTITSSMRLYAETFNKAQFAHRLDSIPITVPYACAKFKHEVMYLPDSILKDKFVNLVHSTDLDDGGHFAALEVPQLLADDIWSAIDKFLNIHSEKIEL